MPGFDQVVRSAVCSANGHRIVSMTTSRLVDPKTNQVQEEISTLCAVCGVSLEEIRTPTKKARQPRQPKPPVEVSTV